MTREYNREIADAVKEFLVEDKWHYTFDDETGIFEFGVALRERLKIVRYYLEINETDYNVYAISPLSANQNDPDEMSRLAEFLCRANYGLRNGNFELDFRDGDLRYRCYVDCDGAMPSMEMIGSSIRIPAAMFDRYGKGILQIMFTDMSAGDAIGLCEGGTLLVQSESNDDDDEEEKMDPSHIMDLLRRLQERKDEDDDIPEVSGE